MHPDLLALADAVEVMDDHRFVVAGYESTADPVAPADALGPRHVLDPDPAPPPARDAESLLAGLIYEHCYVRPSGPEPRVSDHASDRTFQLSLAQAGEDATVWDSGWQLEPGLTNGHVTVTRYGVRFTARPEDVRHAVDGAPPSGACLVRAPTRYQRLLPGFYLVVGSAESTAGPAADKHIVRLYWHLQSHGAPRWLGQLSRLFDAAGVPFRAKVLASPNAYRRADAGVLYMASGDFPRARDLIERIYAQFHTELRDTVPLFTKRLAPGLGLAEDPGNGLSFGVDRCTLVAQALLAAFRERTVDRGSRLARIDAAFRGRGLDAGRPHLCAGSSDPYDLGPRAAATRSSRSRRTATSRATGHRGDPPSLLAGAVAVGDALCASAYWDRSRQRCNWVGRSNNGTLVNAGITPRTDALSWDLYGGLSGVALFLAELFAQTGADSFRHAALGAIRCATDQVERDPAATGASFYTGVTGVAYAACRVGELTQDDALTATLLDAVSAAAERAPAEDYLGSAGAITALTYLARHADSPPCGEAAIAIGRRLCRSELMTRYATDERSGGEPLTGLAHGAAGVALSLLELHAETGADEFLQAARTAFAYEDRRFSAADGNWPDLRPQLPGTPARRARFAIAWCHGAPGIALARLRAGQIDGSRRSHHLSFAKAALDTTRRQLQRTRSIDGTDRTLCHGTAGLIETLLAGSLVLGDHEPVAHEAAVDLALAVTGGGPIRSGTLCGGSNPSLMLGTAGIGYQLLRVLSPDTVLSLLTVPTASRVASARPVAPPPGSVQDPA